MDFRTASIAGAIALTFSSSSFALDLQPYTTKGAPVGKTIFSLGRVSADASSANENSTSVRLTHYFDLAGRRAVVDAKQFHRNIEGKGAINDASGPSAFALGGGVYLIDDKKKGDYLLAGMFVATPTGQYSSTRLANPGANSYTYIPKIAYHKGLTDKIDMAVSADVTIYQDNDKYVVPTALQGAAGATTQKQEKDNMFNAQASFMYAVDPTLNLNASIFYHEGGETKHSLTNQNLTNTLLAVPLPAAVANAANLDGKTQNTQASVGFRKITDGVPSVLAIKKTSIMSVALN